MRELDRMCVRDEINQKTIAKAVSSSLGFLLAQG